MKSNHARRTLRRIGTILAVVMTLAPALQGAAADAEPRDHTLFMGLNIMIQHGSDYYRVLDVANDAALIKVDGQLIQVPFSKIDGYRLKKEPKIGGFTATVSHLTGDRAYTPANDPTKVWHNRETQLTGYADDAAASAAGDVVTNGNNAVGAKYTAQGQMLPNYGQNAFNAMALNGQFNGNGTSVGMAGGSSFQSTHGGNMGDDGDYSEKLQEDLDKKLFDAMRVDFEVSSDRPLPDPYVVVVTEFRENETARETQRWIYIKPLHPIEGKPTSVHVMEGGFPKGFALGKYEVHLYDSGHEIATTVSADRMAITQGEAYLYTGIQYLSDHKGQTLPATPIPESASSHLRDDFNTSELNQTVHVKVSRQGEVLAVDGGDETLPAASRTAWRKLRFYPALEGGKAVASTLDIRLAEFVR